MQILATVDAAVAERLRSEVAVRLGVKAYTEFQAPYYKVRIGNCPSSEACRDLQSRLIQAGYTSVWTIPSPIEP